jgi:hypothetical protein
MMDIQTILMGIVCMAVVILIVLVGMGFSEVKDMNGKIPDPEPEEDVKDKFSSHYYSPAPMYRGKRRYTPSRSHTRSRFTGGNGLHSDLGDGLISSGGKLKFNALRSGIGFSGAGQGAAAFLGGPQGPNFWNIGDIGASRSAVSGTMGSAERRGTNSASSAAGFAGNRLDDQLMGMQR